MSLSKLLEFYAKKEGTPQSKLTACLIDIGVDLRPATWEQVRTAAVRWGCTDLDIHDSLEMAGRICQDEPDPTRRLRLIDGGSLVDIKKALRGLTQAFLDTPPEEREALREKSVRVMWASGVARASRLASSCLKSAEKMEREATAEKPITAPTPPPSADSWRSGLHYTQGRDGKWRPSASCPNVVLHLLHHPTWRGVLRRNELSDSIEFLKDMPDLHAIHAPAGALGGQHIAYLQGWYSQECGSILQSRVALEALEAAADHNRYHPVREYLASLPQWDGQPRIGKWLSTYLGAEETEINSKIGRWWLISAVARAMRPGCKADYMLILEGDQGQGKSYAFSILGGKWYSDDLGNMGDKAAAESLKNVWICEVSELAAIRGREADRVKSFVTRSADHYRPSYGRISQTFPRQCVFGGSTNRETYLTDETGNRRFWPVRCRRPLAADVLQQDRDQIWAESLAAYRDGEKWYPQSRDEIDRLTSVQSERYDVDAWEPSVVKWLADKGCGTELTAGEILEGAVGVETPRQDRSAQTRLGAIMARMPNWRRVRVSRHGCRIYSYRNILGHK